jgi:hypothetical protein
MCIVVYLTMLEQYRRENIWICRGTWVVYDWPSVYFMIAGGYISTKLLVGFIRFTLRATWHLELFYATQTE